MVKLGAPKPHTDGGFAETVIDRVGRGRDSDMLGGARYPYSPEILTRAEADRLVAPPLGGKRFACTIAARRSRARP